LSKAKRCSVDVEISDQVGAKGNRRQTGNPAKNAGNVVKSDLIADQGAGTEEVGSVSVSIWKLASWDPVS
jgi:hypothetical protein